MKFNYIPIESLIADLQDVYKKRTIQGKFDPDSMHGFAVECIREIGGHNYEAQPLILEVNRYNGILPKGFLWLNRAWEIELCQQGPSSIMSAFNQSGKYYQPKREIYGAQGFTQMFISPQYRNNHPVNRDSITYIIKSPPPVLQLSIPKATLGIMYYGLKTDSNGQVYMQDEINAIKCVKAYMMVQSLREEFLEGSLPKYVKDDYANEYETYLPQAQAMMHMETPEELDKRVEESQNRYKY